MEYTDAIDRNWENPAENTSYEIAIEQIECAGKTPMTNGKIIPLDIDHRRYAKEIVKIFHDGFQWQDLGSMIVQCYSFMKEFPHLSFDMRVQSVIKIMEYVIDFTDTPYLPDGLTDPILKKMITPFVTLIAPDNLQHLQPPKKIHGSPSEEDIQSYEEQILQPFKDGFHWRDLASVVYYSVGFAAQFADLSLDNQCNLCYAIVDHIIEKTDTPYVLDSFSDPIFKKFYRPIVRKLLQTIDQ